MRTPRLFVEPPLRAGHTVSLPREAARYVLRVLRLKAGAELVLFDGTGGEYSARLLRASRDAVEVGVGDHRRSERESPLRIRLAQGIGRAERMDLTVQKAAELGVTLVQPLLTSRGVVRLTGERAQRRVAHWRAIAVHACEQCGRNRVPEIPPIDRLTAWLENASSPVPGVVLDPGADASLDALELDGESVDLLIGPEGGLSDAELELSARAGFRAARIGPRILRTETAAIVAIACLQMLHGDLGASGAAQ